MGMRKRVDIFIGGQESAAETYSGWSLTVMCVEAKINL
jgi:hypothetical protein